MEGHGKRIRRIERVDKCTRENIKVVRGDLEIV
jgi:hypothetical protein